MDNYNSSGFPRFVYVPMHCETNPFPAEVRGKHVSPEKALRIGYESGKTSWIAIQEDEYGDPRAVLCWIN